MTQTYPIHGRIDGPLVMIGYGSIGRGTLPLIRRHFDFDPAQLHVIEPSERHAAELAGEGIRHHRVALTRDNFREALSELFPDGRGFCVNLSVDTGSRDLIRLCRELGVLYIDTVVEPWPGFYFDEDAPDSARTNHALRQAVRDEKAAHPGGVTAVSCCGANPGMVSWLLKEALLRIAADTGVEAAAPADRDGWARMMRDLGVKGVHVAERDTQISGTPRPIGTFVNTWSVDGFVAEGFQPAELGWGTHERWFPPNGHRQTRGCMAAIHLDTPGALTRVHTWTPAAGPQFGYLVTHNEAVSISDYYTIGAGAEPEYRPTCHYVYHPCDDAVLSLHETFGTGEIQSLQHIVDEDEIISGEDCLGLLVYGHARNALWYGSRLSIEETRKLAPLQNATGLQVSSAVIAGMAWALANPTAGIVETDEMDHAFCLDVQRPYLGRIEAHYTDWTPLSNRFVQVPADLDRDDPWQFRNVIAD